MDLTKFVVERREAAFLLGDYASYRAQLTRRLRIVQKKLGRATPKNARYAAKAAVTPADVAANIEFLHLLLLAAERAWAHAMAMKALHSEDNAAQRITGSTRRHILSRLHKAVQAAREIVVLLADPASGASPTDALEARAYEFALAGALEFEKQAEGIKTGAPPQRWDACLASFAAARVLYSALHRATRQDLFKDVLSATVDPSIRYAAYQNRIPRTVGVPAVALKYFPKDAELAAAVQKIDPAALQEDAATASTSQITWRGRTANIVDAAIGAALAATDAAARSLQSTASSTPKDRAAAYDAVLTASQDAVDATRRAIDELEKESVPEADPRMQDLRVTSLATSYALISWRIGRNRVLISAADGLTFASASRPRKHAAPDAAPRPEPPGRTLARLRERTALYDAITQSIDAIAALPGAARDASFTAELAAQRAYFSALKCVNLARAHALLANPTAALALCSRALALAPAITTDADADTDADAAPSLAVSAQQAATLKTTLTHLTAHYRGVVALGQLTAATPASAKSAPTAPVVERLNAFPPPAAAGADAALQNLVTWPPALRAVPVKPLFLDVAWNYVGYPGRQTQTQVEETRGGAGEGDGGEKEGEKEEKEKEERPKVKKGWFSFGR
ncbi:hypothetical protein C7974DRAFT_189805 [Boeremia exigua]|uniref:uncharacterized protein n=1 Tax=Boeremia exigua TaxID=749465 RepID=UPI001E8CCC6B|nr:uncharacterized protein C7974DRAFT_189805 [Boeremia exigua]KAH6629608.1 hypothetical protein C7974DRAFT_189805 [Boeremia exigua]